MTDHPDLAALIGSRICHDLISPIGAIGNGVELLMMSPEAQGPELALIAESVASANARIRFFRIAFGLSAADQRIGQPEVTSVLADLTRGTRLAIDWDGPADLPRPEVKLAFLLLMCLETALPYGGEITVSATGLAWSMTARAAKTKVDPDLWGQLSASSADNFLGAAQVHFALARDALRHQGRQPKLDFNPTEIRIAF
ncbi:histidine phosphotransferase [Gemmobacter aquaticus]|uniref:Histidine phosphotransferase n=1 Tax=Gemmobacter aquaticus TaxID=490185 RepID=A0A917YGX2_9RHOB|nr:histidine phosphotransferase family protein [Gemmobacter aquaticus]GGO26505.1 histidine phosphotransferase [Gemmobacter aquaticus]